MDLAAGPDRHWYEHRDERNADRTSTGSTPGTSHRQPGASGRLLCGAAAVAAGAGPRRLWLLFGSGPGSGCGRGDHRVPDAASAVAAVRRGRADRRCDRARPPARRGGAARTTGGAVGLAKCRVQPGRRGGGLVGAEAMPTSTVCLTRPVTAAKTPSPGWWARTWPSLPTWFADRDTSAASQAARPARPVPRRPPAGRRGYGTGLADFLGSGPSRDTDGQSRSEFARWSAWPGRSSLRAALRIYEDRHTALPAERVRDGLTSFDTHSETNPA